jgi:hypothetical protein
LSLISSSIVLVDISSNTIFNLRLSFYDSSSIRVFDFAVYF